MNGALPNTVTLSPFDPTSPDPLADTSTGITEIIIQNAEILILLLLVVASLCFYGWLRNKISGPQRAWETRFGLYEWLCAAVTLALIVADVYAMHNMFVSFGLGYEEHWIYSVTFALFLEGFPIVLGQIVPQIHDPVRYIRGRRAELIRISIFCWVGLIAAWMLAIYIRMLFTYPIGVDVGMEDGILTLQERINATKGVGLVELFLGGWRSYMTDTYGDSDSLRYLGQVFLYVSPILTSILAYAISLTAFGSNNLVTASSNMRISAKRLMWCKEKERKLKSERDRRMRMIWVSLGGSQNEIDNLDLEAFSNVCQMRLHRHMIEECLAAYPMLLKQYNQKIESTLATYIVQIGKHSTVPQLIGKVTVEEITRQYDSAVQNDVDKWDYEVCGDIMSGDLERLLYKAIISAQYDRYI